MKSTDLGKRVVYTALIGGYEDLVEQPIAASTDVPFLCFTDDASLTSQTWDVRRIDPALAMDPVRSSRAIKIRGTPALDGFDESLWIDNTVLLKVDPHVILDDWLKDVDFSLPQHSFRRHVVDEFEIVARLGLDDEARVSEQLAHYSATCPEVLLRPVLWTAILARRKSPLVESTMRVWMDHVLRYSRRDQLSIVHAIATTGIAFKTIPLPNHESPLHSWPTATQRRARPIATGDTFGLPQHSLAMVGHLSNTIDEITTQFNSSVRSREEEIVALQVLVDERDRFAAEVRRSRSWRVTYPLRRTAQAVRAVKKAVQRLYLRKG